MKTGIHLGRIGQVWLPLLATAVLMAAGCQQERMLLGAGSTFDNLLFSKMFYTYYLDSGVKVNYQSIGSGGGIKSLTDNIVDFAASDAVLTPDQEAAVQGKVLHLPMTCGAIVLSYNLPDVKDTLRFTPEIIAGIFLGKITRWNDTAIVRANGGAALPALDIIVVHRSDGSGTTSIFTTYLCKVSPRWQQVVGGGSAVSWPVGIGGKGNDGVAGSIQQTVGSIGYIELAYAEKNHIAFGKVRNKAGRFITPTVNSVSAAANIAIPPDGKAIISNTDAPDGYPLSGLSWVLVRQEQRYNGRTQARARQLSALLRWMVTDGQQYSGPLYYAPLPEAAAKTSLQLINTITYNNQPLLP